MIHTKLHVVKDIMKGKDVDNIVIQSHQRSLEGAYIVIDEMMTPDSSRYWPLDAYRVGTSPPSFDKQYVRDFMDSTGWDHDPPAPNLPAEVIEKTSALYREAYELITGASLDDWYAPDE